MNWFVELPSNTQIAIGTIVLVLVNLALSALAAYVPWLAEFLGRYKEEWAAGITLWLITLIQNVLPEAYPDLSILGVQFVVALVLAMLVKYGLRKSGYMV